MPAHETPLLDWSAHVFVAGRAEYVLLSNTRSLYSTVLTDVDFGHTTSVLERVSGVIRATLEGAGVHQVAAGSVESIRLVKALDRSVTGSMNELIAHATALLGDGRVSVREAGTRLNDVLLSILASGSNKYRRPCEAFAELVADAGVTARASCS